jgi:hypothetical protein
VTGLLIAVLIEVPVVAAVSLFVAHRILQAHHKVMAAVIGRKTRDVREAIGGAEERITRAARTGVVSRAGPARLKD